MKASTKAAIAMFGGAAALAVTVGFGGAGIGPVGGSTSPTTQSSSVAPVAAHHARVHAATLTGCISGENC